MGNYSRGCPPKFLPIETTITKTQLNACGNATCRFEVEEKMVGLDVKLSAFIKIRRRVGRKQLSNATF